MLRMIAEFCRAICEYPLELMVKHIDKKMAEKPKEYSVFDMSMRILFTFALIIGVSYLSLHTELVTDLFKK